MSQISVETYVSNVKQIYQEQPTYRTGGDGSDGTCDCIGMCRGATERAGVTTHRFRGTNDAARYTIKNLHTISGTSELKVGQLVLKQRDMDDKDMPLPDTYRPGGKKYNGDLTNYTHIGTVTAVDPLEITHMTSPTAKKDNKLGRWEFVGENPWVDYSGGDEPVVETATTYAPKGSTVNLRSKKSASSALVDRIPIGEEVTVKSHEDDWCYVTWKGKKGYIMTQFLIFGEYVPGEDDDDEEQDSEQITVYKSDLLFIRDMIDNMLNGTSTDGVG